MQASEKQTAEIQTPKNPEIQTDMTIFGKTNF